MKNYLPVIFFFFLIINTFSCKKSAQNPESGTTIKGWKYIGGDEFNEDKPDTTRWFRYGDGKNANYGWPQGMIQTYRPQQIEMATLPSGEKVLRITSVKRNNGDSINGNPGWWSGAISTRETEIFYPLYCKIEVRAKVANEKGVWHAIWSRYRDGASIAELDLNEFFVKKVGKGVVSQAIHLWNTLLCIILFSHSLPIQQPDLSNPTFLTLKSDTFPRTMWKNLYKSEKPNILTKFDHYHIV